MDNKYIQLAKQQLNQSIEDDNSINLKGKKKNFIKPIIKKKLK